tara:strand:+ start:28 stop:402 length:375 start_codon:yes stop_codon:yes gene_type:complete
MELLLFLLTLSLWNDYTLWGVSNRKFPYLSYTITVKSSKLNIPKLSDYQISLYQKICELRFDENLTWKQVSNKLNELGYKPSIGKVGEFTPQKVWSNYKKIKNNQERKLEVTSLDVDNINLSWE